MKELSSEYARALFDLAQEEKLCDEFRQQLQQLDTAFSAEPDFLRLLANPGISKAERCRLLDECFRENVHLYVLNFLKLLTENGEILSFRKCVRCFQGCYNEAYGILCVSVASAVALSEMQAEKLRQKLEAATGKKVQLETKLDPSCLGGLRLDYDGKRIDGTVRGRLDAMAKQLHEATL